MIADTAVPEGENYKNFLEGLYLTDLPLMNVRVYAV